MRKELLISTKLDTQEFDRSISQMQKKLKELYAPSDALRAQQQTAQRMQGAGMGGIMSQPSMDAYNRSTQQSRRELDQLIREQAQGQEKLGKIIAQRTEKMKELQKQQQELIKGTAEELAMKEKLGRMEENNFRLRENYKQRDAALNQMLDTRESARPQGIERLMQAYRGGGIGGMARAGGRMLGGMGPGGIAGLAGAAMMGIGAIGGVATDVYRGFGRAPIETELATGSAVRGTLGTQMSDIYSGRTPFELPYAKERQFAAAQAMLARENARRADISGMGFGLLRSAGTGVGAGAGIGAAVGGIAGSIVPGVGTAALGAAGGAIGGIAGGIYGGVRGLANIFGDERSRALALSPISKTMDRRYQSILAEQVVKDYEGVLEAQKQQNPIKTFAIQEYRQNFMRNLQAQRSMGLGFEGFHGAGGFLAGAQGAGFTPEMGLEMSGGILGAGGSTRMARDSTFGLQMQRGANLTNASQILGTLSGGLGSSEATKQATIKILAEGTKLGLDDSKFAEENRKFAQAAAEVVSRGGARTEGDVERLSARFASMVTEKTSQGVEAAKGAYERFQQMSTETGGRRGMMRAAGMLQSPELGGLFSTPGGDLVAQALMHIPEGQLTEDHPVVRQAARALNKSPSEIIKSMESVTMGSISPMKEMATMRESLRKRQQETGITVTDETYGSAPKDMQETYDKIATIMSLPGIGADVQDPRQLKAMMGRVTGGMGEQYGPATAAEAAKASLMMGAGETGRVEDTTVKELAETSKIVLNNFRDLKSEMMPTADAVSVFTNRIRELGLALSLSQTPEDKRRLAEQFVKEQAGQQLKAKTQSQAGKVSQ